MSNINKLKVIGNILFWGSIISLPLSFTLSGIIGEVEIFGVTGIIRYSWIMLLFVPIGVFSVLIGRMLKAQNKKYIKNYIAAFICIPLLLIFGSYRFIFDTVSYDTKEVITVEEKIEFDLPNNIKTTSLDFEEHIVSRIKITDSEEKSTFENTIYNSEKWTNHLNSVITNGLPFDIQAELAAFDYFMFYNESTNEYNVFPSSSGEYESVFIAYDSEIGRFIILNDYIFINK